MNRIRVNKLFNRCFCFLCNLGVSKVVFFDFGVNFMFCDGLVFC